jgi:hypothetical protein
MCGVGGGGDGRDSRGGNKREEESRRSTEHGALGAHDIVQGFRTNDVVNNFVKSKM